MFSGITLILRLNTNAKAEGDTSHIQGFRERCLMAFEYEEARRLGNGSKAGGEGQRTNSIELGHVMAQRTVTSWVQ